MENGSTNDQLLARIEHLEKNRRFIQNALEQALSLSDLSSIHDKNGDPGHLLEEIQGRVKQIISFEMSALYLMGKDDSDFILSSCNPTGNRQSIEDEVEFMIDKGLFAWALRERRGVFVSSKDHSRQFLVHVIASSAHIKGMFVGMLSTDEKDAVPDVSLTLLSILLFNTANELESIEFRSLTNNQKGILQRQLEEKTKELTHSERQLARAQRMEAIGTLAGGIAHNFNNLLMAIMGNTSMILLDVDPSHPHFKGLQNIEEQVRSGAKLTSQLLGYAMEGQYDVKRIDLNRLVEETSDTFGTARKEIIIYRDLATDLFPIEADQGQVKQTLMNLYANAADAMPRGGEIYLTTVNITHMGMAGKQYGPRPGKYVLLTIRDTGAGMDKETTEKIFNPFFTTKGLAGGTGLGLASVYGIIKAHGGYIDVESKEGHGTTFRVYMPATDRAVCEKTEPPGYMKGQGTILIVDDEEMVLDATVAMLRSLGYDVLSAMGGEEALEQYKKWGDKIDVVLLDMVMPYMGGGETFDRLKEMASDIRVLLSSGYSVDGEATDILQRGCKGFIQKPFRIDELSHKLNEIFSIKA